MTAKRTPWLAACVLVAYGALLIRFVVFKAIPVIHIGHLRLRFAGTHTGPGNFVPLCKIAIHPSRRKALFATMSKIACFR